MYTKYEGHPSGLHKNAMPLHAMGDAQAEQLQRHVDNPGAGGSRASPGFAIKCSNWMQWLYVKRP